MTSTTDINAEAATLPTLDSNSSEPPATEARVPDRAASGAGHQLGRYRVLRVLGQGSAGVVHTAYDQTLDRVVALKTIRTDRSTSTGVGRFIREAKALARLSHPNIVHIYDVSTSGGQVFLAMEFIRGRTLRQHLADPGGAPCSDIVALFVAAGQGLAAVHRAGLVHRDFKPDNVMVGDDGRVHVLDFGLVRDAQGEPSQETGGRGVFDVDLTTTGCVLGTPAYMAPEQHRGGEADARSDVFSFCASLYEALYGQRPFVADSYEALRAAMLEGTVRPPTQSRVPAWLRDVVLRGLRADPTARWPAMEPLLAALAADLGARRRRWLRRIGLVSAIAGLTLVGTLATLQLRRAWLQERVEALAAEHLAGVEAEPVVERADAAFAAFVEDPAHRGTRALAQAWQHRGDRRGAAGRRDEALADYARAYAEASTREDASEALRRIARIHLGGWNTATFSQVVATLPAELDDAEATDLRIAAALRRRDLPAANSFTDASSSRFAGLRPLIRELTPGLPVGIGASAAIALPAGGPWSAAIVDDTDHELVLLDHQLRPGPRWRSDAGIYLVQGDAPWALTQHGDEGRLLDVTRPEPPLARFPAEVLAFPRGIVDADRDGRPELYFGFKWPVRGFHVVDPEGMRVAHEPSHRTGSDLEAIVAADLDGDGVQEIVAAFGPPRAFDLRVFHVDHAGELELVGRRQFGWVRMLGLLRRPDGTPALVAVRDGRGENVDVFPESPHYGEAPGVYLLRWSGAELTTLAHAPPPHDLPLIAEDDFVIADLDGDGHDEVAVPLREPGGAARHTLLVRQTVDGGLDPFVLGHCEPLAAVRLAADAPHRLLVADSATRALWALGAGDEPFPPVAAPPSASVPPPPALTDDLLRKRWTRADDLAAAGMPASAAEVLRDSASMVGDEGVRRRFHERAAALFASAGQPAAALALDAENLDDPALAPDALLRRATLLTDLGSYQEAASAARQLRADPGRSAAQEEAAAAILGRLASLLDAREGVELRFDAATLPAWRFDRPATLRMDPVAGALHVEALASQGRLAALPVRWDGGPLEIEVELDVARAEYNSALSFALVDEAGRPLIGVDVGGRGDRKFRLHEIGCQPVGQYREVFAARPVSSAATPHRIVMRATFFPDRGVTECVADDDGQRTHEPLRQATHPRPGRYSLVIGNTDPYAENLLVADLRRITLRGARLDDVAADTSPAARIGRALVTGDAPAAWALLEQIPPTDPRQALLALLVHDALARLVDPAVVATALSGLEDADLLHLLRTRPGLAPAVRAAAGARIFRPLAEAWLPLARHHFDDPALQRELLAALDGIETLTADDDADRRALGVLLHARAKIHLQLGRHAHARRDFEQALVAFGASPDAPGEPLRTATHLALVFMLVDDDPDAALGHMLRAVACDHAPELAQDRLRHEPRVAARAAADPAWARVLTEAPPPATCAGPSVR
ncbi:serine/threonine-protein kinase [Nannocystis sp. RBIL2]|uniref:serine/threonine-protein kinase n=1 Tax=Nannocystis sp. RBIL2 TaxID=2996788 RepID=UPI00226F4160|nr:serine/threonine-protein kinase [Nannocystis sp. RBIL2]MCY1071358.1 serine/threonine-protein kinase [Nannocystis sp. RBIL2]